MKILIIGAGLFGVSAAIELSKEKNFTIDLIEKERTIMGIASRCNHNRLHLGYHYLRSKPTAKQSLEGLLSFMFNFGKAALYQFPNYYAVAKLESKTSTQEFMEFCTDVGIGFDEEYPSEYLLNREMVDSCFRVPEPIFDHSVLQSIAMEKLINQKNIHLKLNCKCTGLTKSNHFKAILNNQEHEYDIVVNATYSGINEINAMLGLPLNTLRYEQVFIPYFLYPSDKFGLTIMDGEFCSIMPKGNQKNEFLLYHVKHSVISSLNAKQNKLKSRAISPKDIQNIYQESQLYYPFLEDAKHFGLWNTTRAVYENKNDARITELYTYNELSNYYMIFSGKISTSMQVALYLKNMIQGKTDKKRFII